MRLAALAPALLLAGCVPAAQPAPQPVPARPAPPAPRRVVVLPDLPVVLEGEPRQGGLVFGRAASGIAALMLDGERVPVANDGRFVIGFDRDAPASALLAGRGTGASGDWSAVRHLAVAPGAWRIERVDAPYRAGRTSAEFDRLRPGELAQIAGARARDSGAQGWRQRFRWPVIGRISGLFGAQRVYRGQPGSFHGGIDVARPTGTPVTAPADGTVVLAGPVAFTLEGRLLILDHGHGLSSAFLHLSAIDVVEGQAVTAGQRIGAVGATGRATGPHLHWGIVWRGRRIDPQPLVPAMP